MKYKVKLSYGPDYLFDNIEEAAIFFDQALKHANDVLRWAAIEPVCPESDDAEEVNDTEEVEND